MIVARRILRLVAAGTDKQIDIVISAPEQRNGAWWCSYEIGWPDGRQTSEAGGYDSLQALQMAMLKIGTELYTSDAHRNGLLAWEKPGSGYGFPVPKNIRHMLVGDDALYD